MTVYAVMVAPVPSQDFGFCNVICRGLVYVQWVRGYCSFGPVYESINENQMLSNLALAMQSNGRTVRQLKQSQSTSQLMKNNKSLTSSRVMI
jgi:hypothetical protein